MYYSSGLEYAVNSHGGNYNKPSYRNIDYFSKSVDDNYGFKASLPLLFEPNI